MNNNDNNVRQYGLWVPYDPIQGQGHRDLKDVKIYSLPGIQFISSAGMHVIKRLTVNHDTPRQ